MKSLFSCFALLAAVAVFASVAPARAETHAGIELGAKGIKAIVLEINGSGEDAEINVKLNDTTNTALADGIAKNGKFDAAAVAQTVAAIKKYHERMTKEFGVAPNRLHVVGSSGLFAAISKKPDAVKSAQEALAGAVSRETGLELAFISVQLEADLSIRGIIPVKKSAHALLVDIGGGNTKGGFLKDDGNTATFGVPYGMLTWGDLVTKSGANDAAGVRELASTKLAPAIKAELEKLGDLKGRENVYLSGGLSFVVATLAHPGSAKGFTPLSLEDVGRVEAMLAASGDNFPSPDLSGIKDARVRERAQKELARAAKVYTPAQLRAGLALLKTVYAETDPTGKKHFFFARNGYLGWILAYVSAAGLKG